jgi:hypothetical protein
MQMFSGTAATLAVATIYCIWRTYFQKRMERERQLRERVTYMLWVLASRV